MKKLIKLGKLLEFNKIGADGWRKRTNPSESKQGRRKKKNLGYGIYQKELGMIQAWPCTTVRRGRPRSPGAFRTSDVQEGKNMRSRKNNT